MASSVFKSTNEILFACIGVITFLLCFGLTLWAYRHYQLRGFHLNDYRKLVLEAKLLSAETLKVRREVELDLTADEATMLTNRDLLKAAEDWDTGIRMALSAWEDVMLRARKGGRGGSSADPDDEKFADGVGGGGNEKYGKDGNHGRYIISIMRAKGIEGVERRKEVSGQLGKIVAEVRARRVNHLMSKLNSRSLPSVVSIEMPKPPPAVHGTVKPRPVRPPLSQLHFASYEGLYGTNRKVVPPPRRAMSCAPEERKGEGNGDKLNGLGIYV